MSSQPVSQFQQVEQVVRPRLELVTWEFEPAIFALILNSERWEHRSYVITKRLLDVLGSTIALLAGLPLFAAIAIAIKLTSRGPIIFGHNRLGCQGKEFCCYKFRTMVVDADEQLRNCAELRQAFQSNFKLQVDPRVTPLGSVLRRFSLDELPQFWNVLKGEMTLIGPRPIVPEELEKYGPYSTKLLSVTPGLSGLWQTCGRSDTTYQARVQLDMLYVDHRSLWLDITLVFRTCSTVLRRAGAC